ncbi:UDP-glucose 4-epimerase [Phycisphaerae bacterium RAS1]|nr:UDP-glucose 4-epimerase [Phycisphaerae bacterium RAS1]
MSLCLVTGGAGFIGSHLARRLLDDGQQVRVIDNLSTGRRENMADFAAGFEFIHGDICDAETVQRAVAGAEVVFHLAARSSVPRSIDFPVEAHAANATGTLNLLEASRAAGVRRLVYSSSSSAYGDTPVLPKREDMRPQPLSPYAVSKLAAEQYCSVYAQVYGLQTVSLRYFNVFGPKQNPASDYAAVIPAFVTRMARGEKPIVYGDGEQSRDFCYIDNVVQANLLAARAGKVSGEVVNIGCGERTTLNAIIVEINRALGTSLPADYRPARAGDVRHSLADIGEAKRVIGYEPRVMFAEGLKRSIEWYRQQVLSEQSRSAASPPRSSGTESHARGR